MNWKDVGGVSAFLAAGITDPQSVQSNYSGMISLIDESIQLI